MDARLTKSTKAARSSRKFGAEPLDLTPRHPANIEFIPQHSEAYRRRFMKGVKSPGHAATGITNIYAARNDSQNNSASGSGTAEEMRERRVDETMHRIWQDGSIRAASERVSELAPPTIVSRRTRLSVVNHQPSSPGRSRPTSPARRLSSPYRARPRSPGRQSPGRARPRRDVDSSHHQEPIAEMRHMLEVQARKIRSLKAALTAERMTYDEYMSMCSDTSGPVVLTRSLTRMQMSTQLQEQERYISRLEAAQAGKLSTDERNQVMAELSNVTERATEHMIFPSRADTARSKCLSVVEAEMTTKSREETAARHRAALSPRSVSPQRIEAATGRDLLERMENMLLGKTVRYLGAEVDTPEKEAMAKEETWNELADVAQRVETTAKQVETIAKRVAADDNYAHLTEVAPVDTVLSYVSATKQAVAAAEAAVTEAAGEAAAAEEVVSLAGTVEAAEKAPNAEAVATAAAARVAAAASRLVQMTAAEAKAVQAASLATEAQDRFQRVEDVILQALSSPVVVAPAEAPPPVIQPQAGTLAETVRTEAAVLLSHLFSRVDDTATGHLDEMGAKEFLRCIGCEASHLQHTWSELLRTHSGEASDGYILRNEAVDFVLAHEELDANGFFEDEAHEAEIRAQISEYKRPAQPTMLAEGAEAAPPPLDVMWTPPPLDMEWAPPR